MTSVGFQAAVMPRYSLGNLLFLIIIFNFQSTFACQNEVAQISKEHPTANYAECEVDSEGIFNVTIRPEDTPINPSPWYGFKVDRSPEHLNSEVLIRLNYKGAPHRYPPKWQVGDTPWQPLSEDYQERIDDYTLLLTIPNESEILISAQPIIDTESYGHWFDQVSASYPNVTLKTVGYSIAKRPIQALIVNERATRYVLLLGRQHPPEIPGAFALFGFVEHLLEAKNKACVDSNSNRCSFFRQTGFVVVPLINPDGVEEGYWRHNLGSKDLNRDWFDQEQPEVKSVVSFIQERTETGKELILHLDFHSTNRDVLYTQPASELTSPPKFAENWLLEAKNLNWATLPEHAPRPLTEQGTTKGYFYKTYGVASITYEVGDNTSEKEARLRASQMAESMINVLSSEIKEASPPRPLQCDTFFCHLLDANAASLIVLENGQLIDSNLAREIAKAQLDIQSQPELPVSTNYLDLEEMLIDSLGSSAANVHIGRSRQDLHGITRKMVTRELVFDVWDEILLARQSLLSAASRHMDTLIPAYTHGVPSQPTTYAHMLLAFDAALDRDTARLAAAYRRLNRSQLGVAAGSGSGYGINRDELAGWLGFKGVVHNSFDGNFLSTADYKIELGHAIANSLLSLSKFIANVHTQQRQPIPWISLSDEVTSGSSIMPQKRNPRPLDRLRTKISEVLAIVDELETQNLNIDTGMHDYRQISTLTKLLNKAGEAYRDFSELVESIQLNPDLALAAISRTYSTSTELADFLYREKGIPFRDSHEYAKRLTNLARASNQTLAELTRRDFLETYEGLFGERLNIRIEDLRRSLTPENFIDVRGHVGEPGPAAVRKALQNHRDQLNRVARGELEKEVEHLAESRYYLHRQLNSLAEHL